MFFYASFFFTDTAMGRDAAITPPQKPQTQGNQGRVGWGETENAVHTALTKKTHEEGIHTKKEYTRRESASK